MILKNGDVIGALKGQGGRVDDLERSKSSFLLFLTKGSVSYQMLFTGSKNIVFEILKIRVFTVRALTLNAISQKWTFSEFKNLSSPTNFEIDP